MGENGLFYYLTRHPEVKITKRNQLEQYHRKGRYKEMEVAALDFGSKQRSKNYSAVQQNEEDNDPIDETHEENEAYMILGDFEFMNPPKLYQQNVHAGIEDVVPVREVEEVKERIESGLKRTVGVDGDVVGEYGVNEKYTGDQRMSFDAIGNNDEKTGKHEGRNEEHMRKVKKKKETHLDNERIKLERAVQKLTLEREDSIDHGEAVKETARCLNEVRNGLEKINLSEIELADIKSRINRSSSADEIVMIINSCTELKRKFSNVEHSRILEQLLKISSNPQNPLVEFPLNINKNHYCDIIEFAIENAPDVLGLVLKLKTQNEAPINVDDVVSCAYTFSSLASSVSRLNNSLKKTKSISTKNNGLTNSGLDELAHLGIVETSRSYRNDRDFLASLSDHILKMYAQFSTCQITFDNMDMTVGGVMHHMTLPFLEFEMKDTSNLSMEEKSFDEALEFFKKETVLMKSLENKDLLSHYQYVVAWTLGRLFGDEVEGFSWLKSVFPKHYKHPNSDTSSKKSTIFTLKPLNFCENNNREMIKIMEHLQWMYLSLVAEQSEDKETYLKDLKIIYNIDVEASIREAAEKRIKKGSIRIKKCPKKWKKSTIFLIPPPSPRMFWTFLNLGKI